MVGVVEHSRAPVNQRMETTVETYAVPQVVYIFLAL